MADAHIKTVVSTKPPHDVIRKEACTCSMGRDHQVYESP